MNQKHMGLAIALSFMFGPIGLLYASVRGAGVMLVLTVGAMLVTFGVGVLIAWPACVLWAVVATNRHNELLALDHKS